MSELKIKDPTQTQINGLIEHAVLEVIVLNCKINAIFRITEHFLFLFFSN
jgi:hypothetical protein